MEQILDRPRFRAVLSALAARQSEPHLEPDGVQDRRATGRMRSHLPKVRFRY